MGNKMAYNDQFWEEYNAYNIERSNVYDFPMADYKEKKAEYTGVGISENDYECIKKLAFADKEVFSKETLNSIFNINSLSEKYNFNIIDIIIGMIKTKESWFFLALAIIFIYFDSGEKRIYYIVQSIITYGMVAALFFRNRSVLRVIAPLYVVGIIFMMYVFLKYNIIKENKRKKWGIYATITVMTILMACYGRMSYNMSVWHRQDNQEFNVVNNYLEQQKQNLYVATVFDRNLILYNQSIMDIDIEHTSSNLISLGDWDIYNDIYYSVMDKYQVTYKDRLILDIVEDDNVLLLTTFSDTSTKDMLKKYVEEHTGRKVEVILQDEIKEADIAIYNMEYIN